MPDSRLRFPALLLTLVLAAGVAACGSDDGGGGGGAAATPAANACAKGSLPTQTKGQLTVGTDKPAFPPYFEDDDPTNGKGFESAVAYEIAKRLGFTQSQVKWVTVPFTSSYAPGPKTFDFDINQISITDARQKVVDFSTPYYTAPQAVVAKDGSAGADATSLAALKSAKIGVQIGTTSLDAVKDKIAPSSDPRVFDTNNDVVAALKSGQVDAVVVDLPTAFYLTAAQVENAKIVGQFSVPGGDTWGTLLQKDSKLTACVSKAIDAMKADNTLSGLTDRWMGQAAGAPELK
jgi:polar amino acid transport system substrate-binding protein